MVPNKFLPSQLGEIPTDWSRVKFSDVMSVRQGLQISISKRLKVPTKTSKEYITIQSIKKTEQVREYVEAPTKRVTCSKEDVLMTRTGNTGIVVTDVEGAFHNNFFLMDFDRQQVDRDFLVNYLRSNRVQHLILTKAGASTIPDLNHKDFYSIEFPLASLPEQRKIATILGTWYNAISTTERLIDNSKQQKKALMQQLLTGKKRLLDDSGKPFKGMWEEVKLKSIAEMNSGGTPKSSIPEYYGGDIPWVSIADMTKHGKWISKTEKYLTQEGLNNSSARIYPKGTILYAMYASIGECSIAEVELSSSQAILGIRPTDKLSNNYLYYFLTNLKSKITLMGQQGTQSNLNAGMVRDFIINLPPKAEQLKIASVLNNADQETVLLEQQLADLKQEKKALMQQLLTGKRRVTV
ncbi:MULTISPECIES: restriction endonuclease subunit S [Pseudoalteromonas]|uniref:restriction endonuclease subunit S n=1 Tax=Pseudoalteromonas TaxID=53246 RepID=UPI001788925F|nr:MULTISPECIES: restriction endonuclease subunit S [Pseudoalteromonas]MBE0420990.1 restriction endonuclease subunit S [Pseudoalteromonas nigrifaciens]MDC9566697.1 restriction endonuclease subunit S [Pseudoalteromonas sp. GAB2316C]MDC9570939.1 restriction endonuclease subunit S [Pseudoalteromonas sp. GABNB9D]MDC9575128.1 restriction endonuclease subunit S [Pseudoalteromonas sp. GABNS16A]MDC9579424.1 restriction endonuclease subunit S [Pseudoalteromonas sp. GABNS16E]